MWNLLPDFLPATERRGESSTETVACMINGNLAPDPADGFE